MTAKIKRNTGSADSESRPESNKVRQRAGERGGALESLKDDRTRPSGETPPGKRRDALRWTSRENTDERATIPTEKDGANVFNQKQK